MSENVKRGRGRPKLLSSEIVAAAVQEIGFDNLTFAKVAKHLGVSEATLYRHAGDRNELVCAAIEHTVRQHNWPPLEGDWQHVLKQWGIAAWHLWHKIPGAVKMLSAGTIPTVFLELHDALAINLTRHGFKPREAIIASHTILSLAAEHARLENPDHEKGSCAAQLQTKPENPKQTPDTPTSTPENRAGHASQQNRVTATGNILGLIEIDEKQAQSLDEAKTELFKIDPYTWYLTKLDIILKGISAKL